MRKFLFVATFLVASVVSAMATNVQVTMNAVSTTMTLAEKSTGTAVTVGTPTNKVYNFTANPGTYVLTAYDTDGTTVNGTMELEVGTDDVEFKVLTVTAYATNGGWAYGTDYVIEASVVSREGANIVITLGDSKTAGRKTFLALNGATYLCDMIPTFARAEQGYTTLYRSGTLTNNTTCSGAIPEAITLRLTAPQGATVFVGRKTVHFVPFIPVMEDSVVGNTYYYKLAKSTEYNYRVSKTGLLTHAAVFSSSTDFDLVVTEAEMQSQSPKWIDRDLNSKEGYNVADLFLNINEQEHLKMTVGEDYDLLPMRNWQAINSITGNYFIEPDYHYHVSDLNGQPSTSVVTIDPDGTLHAVGNGTAIVTVIYDAIYLTGTAGGNGYWSAIWPENTGVFVVTVGDPASEIDLGMLINPTNTTQYKLAGQKYDADFDVFYFPDTVGGCHYYTFHPTNVVSVEVAYPTIGVNEASYTGFTTNGVSYDANTGDYTVRVGEGKQIVKLTNSTGVSEYQVLVGKPVHIETYSTTRGPQTVFEPGDKVVVQMSGLFHPANKLAGIHNFSATTTMSHYGATVKGSGNQYKYASSPAAQAITIQLPDTLNVENYNYEYVVDPGYIKVSGFGDPIGNHRNVSKKFGRGANFTAINQQAIFGYLPGIKLQLRERVMKQLTFSLTPADAIVTLVNNEGTVLTATNGVYDLPTATYNYTVERAGYHTIKGEVVIGDNSPALTTVTLQLQAIDPSDTNWDGITTSYEPELREGWYCITSGYHMAWFAAHVNAGNYTVKGKLMNDIALSNYNWTPIGGNAVGKAFKGQFDGQNHIIRGLHIEATTTYQALFGYVSNGSISNLTVEGNVTSTANYAAGIAAYLSGTNMTNCVNRVVVNGAMYVAGLAGSTTNTMTIDHCVNEAAITGTGNYVGGITTNTMNKNVTIKNCYNIAPITGGNYVAGITANMQQAATVKNVYNIGVITATGTNVGAIRGHKTNGTFDKIYANKVYYMDTAATVKTTIMEDVDFQNGHVANLLGAPYGQQINEDMYPVLDGPAVYQFGLKEDADTTISYINETVLPDTVWVSNIYASYYNTVGQKVDTVNSDTVVSLLINVRPMTGAATFEERTLHPEAAWYGDPDFENEDNYWTSGDYIFSTYWDNWGTIYYYDITMANLTGKTFSYMNPYYDQYSAAGGAAEGQNYAIWYKNWYGNANITLTAANTISGVAVTNNAWVVDAIKNGDGMSVEEGGTGLPFHQGDWIKLTITGYDDEEGITGTVEFYLADFRTVGDWKYAENWQWVDLAPLGEVSAISFALSSSKYNTYGMTTPAYFCFDNLGGQAADCRLGAMTHVSDTPSAIDNANAESAAIAKRIENGHLMIILPNGKRINAIGQEVR